jgi:hypothetical protein
MVLTVRTGSQRSAAALAAIVFSATVAEAQPLPPPSEPLDPPGPLPVTLHASHYALAVELFHPRADVDVDPPIARCVTPCIAHLAPGRYRVRALETEDTLGGSRIVEITGPSDVEVDPHDPSQRTVGLALGIGGPIAIMGGALLVLSGICIEECRADRSGVVLPGLLLMLSGVVATPIGWIMFGKSFHPGVQVTPLYPMGAEPTALAGPRRAGASDPFVGLRGAGLRIAF